VKRFGSLATTGLPQAIPSATYDRANRLANWNGTALSYDANGNMLGDGNNTYTWNARNLLASIGGGSTASFQYDGVGRRPQKSVGSQVTQYLHDGLNPVQELNANGTPTANPAGERAQVLIARGTGERHQARVATKIAISLCRAIAQCQRSLVSLGL
jgi:hypothetical protein